MEKGEEEEGRSSGHGMVESSFFVLHTFKIHQRRHLH